MDKSKPFCGHSVFGQLISSLDAVNLSQLSLKHKADRYIRKFKSKDHLISLPFCVFVKCRSLREVSEAMLGLLGKTKHFKLELIPSRNTL